MRIGLVCPVWFPVPPEAYGGTERVVALLADGLVDAGHDVTLFASGDSQTRARLESVFHTAPSEWIGHTYWEMQHAMHAFLKADEFDVVHDHTGMLGLAFGGLIGTPFCHTVHGPLDGQPGRMYEQVLELAPSAKLISISMNQRKPKPHLPWIGNCPNALDLSMYPFRRKPGGDYLVFLGRMSPDKGAHRALAVALETGIPLKIAAKCREPLEIRYFDEFIRPHLGGSIEYVGEVGHADKVELLMGARALISPIDWEEPFGLMMIEAMACGTPVISTRRGAVPEIVDHGRTGVIVDQLPRHGGSRGARARRLARSRRDPQGSRRALLAREHGGELRRRVRGDDRGLCVGRHGCRLYGVSARRGCEIALAVRPRDPRARAAGAGRARRGAALPPRRHGDRRASRSTSARRARDRVHHPRRHVRDLQLPPVRDDRAGRAGRRCGRAGDGASARRPGGVALARVRHRRLRADRCCSRSRSCRSWAGTGRRGGLRRDVPPHRGDRLSGGVSRARRAGISPWRCRPAHAARHPHRRERRERLPRAALRLRLRLGDRRLGVGDGDRAARDGSGVRRRRPAAARARRGSRAARARAARAVARQVDLHPHDCADALVRPRRCGRDALRRCVDRGAPGRVPALDLPRARARRGRDRGPDHRRA